MRAYLLWERTWRNAIELGQIGKGDRPEQNPPPLDDHSTAVYGFFNESVNQFVREFGLMPELMRDLRIPPAERPFFLEKMNMIYKHAMDIAKKDSDA